MTFMLCSLGSDQSNVWEHTTLGFPNVFAPVSHGGLRIASIPSLKNLTAGICQVCQMITSKKETSPKRPLCIMFQTVSVGTEKAITEVRCEHPLLTV